MLQIFGRNLFWYAAVFGTITAISRAMVTDELLVIDPQGMMSLVVQHTHYMPKQWRGKENTEAVRMEFETLFQVFLIVPVLLDIRVNLKLSVILRVDMSTNSTFMSWLASLLGLVSPKCDAFKPLIMCFSRNTFTCINQRFDEQCRCKVLMYFY